MSLLRELGFAFDAETIRVTLLAELSSKGAGGWQKRHLLRRVSAMRIFNVCPS